MKNLHKPLENGLIPLVVIAKMIYNYDDVNEPNFIDFDKPEFYDNKLLVSFSGDMDGCGVTKYLFFDNWQFKVMVYDFYWTSDSKRTYTEVIEYNQIKLLKELIKMGAIERSEIDL